MSFSSKKPQMKKNSCSFNLGKLTVNERWCIIGMLDAEMRINDNIDPKWANEVYKWSVTIPPVDFHILGNQKNLLHKKNQHISC